MSRDPKPKRALTSTGNSTSSGTSSGSQLGGEGVRVDRDRVRTGTSERRDDVHALPGAGEEDAGHGVEPSRVLWGGGRDRRPVAAEAGAGRRRSGRARTAPLQATARAGARDG